MKACETAFKHLLHSAVYQMCLTFYSAPQHSCRHLHMWSTVQWSRPHRCIKILIIDSIMNLWFKLDYLNWLRQGQIARTLSRIPDFRCNDFVRELKGKRWIMELHLRTWLGGVGGNLGAMTLSLSYRGSGTAENDVCCHSVRLAQ